MLFMFIYYYSLISCIYLIYLIYIYIVIIIVCFVSLLFYQTSLYTYSYYIVCVACYTQITVPRHLLRFSYCVPRGYSIAIVGGYCVPRGVYCDCRGYIEPIGGIKKVAVLTPPLNQLTYHLHIQESAL